MQRTDEANKEYSCDPGETVTMTFTPVNTDFRVTFQFNGAINQAQQVAQATNLTFSVPAGKTEMEVFFHFVNESNTGGSYSIDLTGSAGGNFTDKPSVRQAGDLVLSRMYTFNA
jgi:mannose-1-phosphate guanylyltransferase